MMMNRSIYKSLLVAVPIAVLAGGVCLPGPALGSWGTSEVSATSKSSDDSSGNSTSDSSSDSSKDDEKKRMVVPVQARDEAARWLAGGARGSLSALLRATLRGMRRRLPRPPSGRALSDAEVAARLLREYDGRPR